MVSAKIGKPTPSAETIERERKALEMRRDKDPATGKAYTFQAIADELGLYGRSDARKLVQRALKRTLEKPAAELREQQRVEIEEAKDAIWEAVLSGDLEAHRVMIRHWIRESELLGLDHKHGIAERHLALEEANVRLLALAVGASLDFLAEHLDLTAELRQGAVRVLMDYLRSNAEIEDQSAGHADPDGLGDTPTEVVQGEVTDVTETTLES